MEQYLHVEVNSLRSFGSAYSVLVYPSEKASCNGLATCNGLGMFRRAFVFAQLLELSAFVHCNIRISTTIPTLIIAILILILYLMKLFKKVIEGGILVGFSKYKNG
jgi:hypothetical protein